MLGNVWQWTAD